MNYSLYANILQIKNYIPIEKNEWENLIKLIQLPSLIIILILWNNKNRFLFSKNSMV